MATSIYFISGNDEGLVKEKALETYARIKPQSTDDFSNETINGEADNSDHASRICAQVGEAIQSFGFFNSDKVIWLKNANFLGDDVTGRSETTKKSVEYLSDLLSQGLPEGTTLLISAIGVDKRRAFYKWLAKNAEVSVCDKLDTSKEGWQDQVGRLARGYARDLDLSFDGEALELFVNRVGAETRTIKTELEKLKLFLLPENKVSTDDVVKMTPSSHTGVIFEIGKALEERNAGAAIALIDQQLAKGESAIAIMRASVLNTVKNQLFAKIIQEDLGTSITKNALASVADKHKRWLPITKKGEVNTWGLSLAAGKIRNKSKAQLFKNLEACQQVDQKLVTTQLDPKMLLHKLIVEITASK